MKKLIGAVLVLLMFMVTFANADELNTIGKVLKKGKLVLMNDLTAPPWQFRAANGKAAGLSVDLGRLLAAKLDVDLEIRNTEWAGLIPGMMARKSDFLVTTLSTTFKRAQRILYTTETWYMTGAAVVVRNDSKVKDWTEYNSPKMSIAVKTGTVSQEVVKKYMPKANLVTFPSSIDPFEALKAGRVDAVVEDQAAIGPFLKDYDFKHLQSPRPLIQSDTWAFAVRPGDIFTWQYLNFFLTKIKESGELDALLQYWTEGKTWEADFLESNDGLSEERKALIKLLDIAAYDPNTGGKRSKMH